MVIEGLARLFSAPKILGILPALAISAAAAEGPDYSLVLGAGPGSQEGNGIAADADGNIYVTGQFQGPATIGGINLTNAGAQDFFLASFSGSGAPRWTIGAGTSSSDYGTSARIAANGDLLVSASLFTPATLGGTEISGPGGREAVLARFSPAGVLLWSAAIGGAANDEADDLAIDAEGNVILAGRINGLVTIGSATIGTAGKQRQFVAKFNAAGAPLWAQAVTTETAAAGTGLAVDAQNNILFTGQDRFNGQSYVVVAKFSPAGDRIWTAQHLANGNSVGTGIGADAAGNVYACGTFATTAFAIGSKTLENPNFALRGFIAKYDGAGTPLWADRIGGRAYRLAVTSDGAAYASGFFLAASGDFGSTSLSVVGSNDGFVTKHSPGGQLEWVKHAGSDSREIFRSITLAPSGRVHFTGEGSPEAFGLDPFAFSGSVVVARLETAGAPAGPEISVQVSGNTLRISWPADSEGYQIEATSDLRAAFGPAPQITPAPGSTNSFSIPMGSESLFLRLKKN